MNDNRYSRRIVCLFASRLLLGLMALLIPAAPANAAPADAPLMAVRFFEEVLGAADRNAAVVIVSDEAVLHTPEGEFVGSRGAGEFAARLQTSFSDISFVAQEPAQDGDLVTVRWTMTAVHTGAYQGIAPTGAAIALHGIAVLRFDDRAIVEQWLTYDRLPIVVQLQAVASREACDADCLKPRGNR